ncbi:probable dolichyl pyrophosphate Glc1Man9GlcNAc2 alpha-1,3-glucosyltransferase [Trichogramma pretiosum]|uniref:probable dolichyl pyrophosphate Glc1Man9GlcNAc2 alpha-1,3-glucosyltransferase n=1 Tax=Trichogramma pretiosum TaxID=7493 RepID=UPI0006C95BD8|nr:probable dolichyl pyrophosphate Glc1Man9GlcNAc2 alpha-1,3-glucosyltransferase [Trichogramma pretiosum]
MPDSVEDCDNINNLDIVKLETRRRDSFLIKIFILVTCFKVLLIPTYHSTDFEVHRNWLAITHSLPIHEWYTSDKSQWTLDYPPFFAWFEYALSKIAVYVDPKMLDVNNLNYASSNTKLFQRATVIIADLVYAFGIREVGQIYCVKFESFQKLVVLSLCNIGLLVVDHVHFQYNGFLLGILLIALAKVSRITRKAQVIQGAMWFAILLNFKHLYLYVAPAFGVWLLRNYCFKDSRFIPRLMTLSAVAIFVLSLSFGPFVKQIPQVLARLFPFKRGLVHSYWASNAWALYVGADKVLSVIFKRLGWLNHVKTASMTGGLVQEETFAVLPTPSPLVTFIITFLSMVPALWMLAFNKRFFGDPRKFLKCIVICALSSFMFGWHVHEKAILTAIVPLCISAMFDVFDARIFVILSCVGYIALFPLLYPQEFTPFKLILWFIHLVMVRLLFKAPNNSVPPTKLEKLYIRILPLITCYETFLHKTLFKDKLPFLPLAITSIYCALGITYSYALLYYNYLYFA